MWCSMAGRLASGLLRPVRRAHLGDQGRVAHGWRQADSKPLKVAVDDVRLGDKAEGAKVSQADPGQDDVAELAAGRLDHRSVPKSVRHIGSVFQTKQRQQKENKQRSGTACQSNSDHTS